MTRIAAIGLDAAELTLVDRLIDEGRLPHLASFRARSYECRLSNDYFRSGLVWQGFVTGGPPASNAVTFDTDSYATWNRSVSASPAFFDFPSSPKTIAFDVPQMALPRDADGLFVIAWGAHAPGYPRTSRPQGMLGEIDRRFGTHPAFRDDHAAWNDSRSISDLADRLADGARMRSDICRWLMDRMPDWELLITTFSEPHSAGEAFWHGIDPDHLLASLPTATAAKKGVERVYEAVDEGVGRLLSDLPADCITVIFSLHGVTTNTGDLPGEVLLPELVYRAQNGRPYLADPDQKSWEASGYEPVVPPAGRWPAVAERPETASGLAASARKVARAVLPLSVKKGLVRAAQRVRAGDNDPITGRQGEVQLGVDEIGIPDEDMEFQAAAWYRDAWPSSRYFALPTFGDGRIRVNLKGRETSGVVEPADYEATIEEIVTLLGELVDPRTGRPAVAEIIRFEGDPSSAAATDCDLLVVWASGIDAVKHPTIGTVGPRRFIRMGGHNGNGFAWFGGPQVASGRSEERSAVDLPATIADLMGMEPPQGISGSSLLQAPARVDRPRPHETQTAS